MALKYGQYFSHWYSLSNPSMTRWGWVFQNVPWCSGVPVFHCSNYTPMKIDTHLSVIEFHWFPTSINWMLFINIDYYWIIDWFSLIDIVRIYENIIIFKKTWCQYPKAKLVDVANILYSTNFHFYISKTATYLYLDHEFSVLLEAESAPLRVKRLRKRLHFEVS